MCFILPSIVIANHNVGEIKEPYPNFSKMDKKTNNVLKLEAEHVPDIAKNETEVILDDIINYDANTPSKTKKVGSCYQDCWLEFMGMGLLCFEINYEFPWL